MYHAKLMFVVMALLLSACQSVSQTSPAKQELAQIRTAIAIQYLQAQKPDLALKQIQMALAADPHHAKAIGVLAEIHHSDGSVANLQKARQLYEKALALAAADMALHHQYAMFLTDQKEYQAAIKHFEIAGEAIGYADRVVALENLAYLRIEQLRIRPTDEHYRAATYAIDRAIQAGSHLGVQMQQALNTAWLSSQQNSNTH